MSPQLTGSRVLVTGGTKGTGRAVVLALARAGASVVTCSRHDDDDARSLSAELAASRGPHLVLRADMTDPDDTGRLAGACRNHFGTLDALIAAVGAIGHVPFATLPAAQWRRVTDANLTSCFLTIQSVLPLLADGSSVVAIGSRAAAAGTAQRAHYTAAKAALAGMTRSLARELGPRGIRVNLLAPAVIEKEETARLLGAQLDRFRRQAALGRLAVPDDLAAVALFLISDHSRYVSGQTISMDGGI